MDDPPTRFDDLRILEIGDRALFAGAFPDNTFLLWTGIRKIAAGTRQMNFGLAGAWFLRRALREDRFDVIVCHAPLHDPLGARWILRLLGRYVFLFPPHHFRTCGVLFLRAVSGPKTPLAVLDTEDSPAVNRHNFFLFPRCRTYFKRELPPDHGKVFFKTLHPDLPTIRVRRSKFFRQSVARLRPISLGIADAKARQILEGQPVPVEKTADVFFAGALDNSLVRARGTEQLRQLQSEGYVVDLAEPNLPLDEYLARCARAWLAWSPEGLGWDCFRHYEAAVCGAVPVLSRPTIYRHRPLQHGVHCVYYDVEGDGLRTAIVDALGDKARLSAMAQAARAHVLAHHTHRRLCEYVLETVLANARLTPTR